MDEEIYLTDLIEVDVLQRIQDSFSELTGMAALTTDMDGNPITDGSNFTDFCMNYTRETPLGFSRCMRCDKTGAELTMRSKKACSYYCHAGLMDYAAPIMVGDKMIGSFIGGQVLPSEPNLDSFREKAVELGIDPEEYVEAVKRVKIVKPETINKAAEFIRVIAEALSFSAYRSYELRKSNVELEAASQLKGDFLANMSHEIRTPMNAVLGMANLALREEMSDAAKQYLHQIKASAKNLLVIINDILDFSKIESGKMDIINVAYEPLSLINDLSSIANSRIGTKNVEFIIDVNPGMPKMIFGDNVRINQILLNLITNAIKFTNQGEVRLTIDYDRVSDETVIMKASIMDTGIGIKKDDLEKLFNSFEQLDSKRNRNIEGTGLGLAITKNLLKLMGGSISVKSEYGKGSTFSFELPQKIVDKEPAIPPVDKKYTVGLFISNIFVRNQIIRDCNKIGAKVSLLTNTESLTDLNHDYYIIEKPYFTDSLRDLISSKPDKRCIVLGNYDAPNDINLPNAKLVYKPVYSLNLYNAMGVSDYTLSATSGDDTDNFTFVAPDARILIVDDNAVNITVAKGLIEPINMMIDTALSASEAIQMVGKSKYDLIFMDHMMPEVDGVEATRIIRRMFPSYSDTPIIALTANAVGEAKQMFLREGMNDFVAKPIEVGEIIAKLRKWLPPEKILPADQYTAPKKNDEGDVDYKNIPGLNTKKAISMLGSEDLFMTVLKEYYGAIEKNAMSIRNHRFKEEWVEYTIEVHALKSTSRQIGAEELGELAFEMEMAGKENNIELIKEKTDILLDKYLKYKDILAPYFPDVYKKQEIYADTEVILKFIDRIRTALKGYDLMLAEEIVEEMENYKYAGRSEKVLDDFKEALEASDLDSCYSLIDSWEQLAKQEAVYNEIPKESMYEMLDTLQNALNNFDTLQIDESVEAMAQHKYPEAQQELLAELEEHAKISDIDSCCEIVAKWRELLS